MYKLRNKSRGMKEEGITLIALVVTIIVLLIIVGIVIAMLRKDGVIEKAKDAKEETVVSREIELIKLAYQTLEAERVINGEDITTERIGNELKKYDEKTRAYSIDENEIGEKNIVVKKENEDGYAEIEYIETSHKYVVSLVIEKNASTLYNIKYNLGGGKINGNPSQYSPTETVRLKNPTRSWYRFIGWTGSNGNIPQMSVIIPKGSTEDKEYTANWIEIEAICKIGETKYETIQEAIDSCSKSAGEKRETIVMLKSTEEEIDTYEGQNIILDLKGYTIKSENIEKPLCINYGNLQIIDTSAEKSGKIENLNGIGVLNSGTFTLGDNNTSIDNNTPTIFGKQIGIKNEGTLNFYDGKIQGITPIQGNVNDTPAQYGPIATDYSNGITTLQLGIVTGYEARIGWVYYTSLQGAIDSSRTKETVSLIKNIQLKRTAEVAEKKDMILDLSGYELTASPSIDKIIHNHGKIVINDTSFNSSGSILTENQMSYEIYNNGSLTINGGNLSSKYGSCVYNYSNGNVIVNGGKIEVISGAYGIYNKNDGNITINKGKFSLLEGSNGNSVIYNANNGNVYIYGGEITCNSVEGKVIYNKSGYILIDGGKIEAIRGKRQVGAWTSYLYMIENEEGQLYYKTGEVTGNDYLGGLYAIKNGTKGILTIENGKISMNSDKYVYDRYGNTSYGAGRGIYNFGKTIITGGIISCISTCRSYDSIIGIDNSGQVEASGNSINIKCEGTYGSGIGIENKGTTKISNVKISVTSSSTACYGIYNSSNKANTIIENNFTSLNSSDQTYIYSAYTGSSSNGYAGSGIYNYFGCIEFYAGKIESNIAIEGNITKVRDGYKINKVEKEKLEFVQLLEKNNEYVVKIDNEKFYTLQEAIDSINQNEEKKIEILNNLEINSKIEINKNVTLDLCGYKIENNGFLMENSKNLVIIDSSVEKTGKIVCNSVGIGLLNSGEGNITINSVILNTYGDYGTYTIYNNSSGKIEINSANLNCVQTANKKNGRYYIVYNATEERKCRNYKK